MLITNSTSSKLFWKSILLFIQTFNAYTLNSGSSPLYKKLTFLRYMQNATVNIIKEQPFKLLENLTTYAKSETDQ